MTEPKAAITLQSVNDILLSKLHTSIAEAEDVATLVALSGAVAKLNTSAKGNTFFTEPESDEERLVNSQLEAFDVLNGEVISDIN